MYADLFTKPLQGAKFRIFQAMIQVIPESTPDVDMSCPISMDKATSQDLFGQNYRQTYLTSTVSTDARVGTFVDTQTRVITIKDARISTCIKYFLSACTDVTCMENRVSVCTDVSTESMGVQGRTCFYISTKGTGMHGVTSME